MWCKSAVQILYEHWGVYSLFRGGKEVERFCFLHFQKAVQVYKTKSTKMIL